MSADDSLLFIDANKYLDLYRTDSGKKLLAQLEEQAAYIFITQQVVAEVQRNKILVAADFLGRKSNSLKIQTSGVPDHLSGTSAGQDDEIRQKMREISQKAKEVNKDVDALALGIMEQINRSEDEVSKVLIPIFAKAVAHSPEELQKARDRREIGNPPGKSTNALGDQVTWEQILTHFKGKKRLWIISRDGDYGTVYGGKGFLNGFLYEELCKIAPAPEVYLFQELVEGIEHFVTTTGVKAENRLTPEEAEEIEKEEKSLPHLPQEEDEERHSLADLANAAKIAQAASGLNGLHSSILDVAKIAQAASGLNGLHSSFLDVAKIAQAASGLNGLHSSILDVAKIAQAASGLNGLHSSVIKAAKIAQTAPELHGLLPPTHQLRKGNQEKKKKPPAPSPQATQKDKIEEKKNDGRKSG
jgi:hypothetical protein